MAAGGVEGVGSSCKVSSRGRGSSTSRRTIPGRGSGRGDPRNDSPPEPSSRNVGGNVECSTKGGKSDRSSPDSLLEMVPPTTGCGAGEASTATTSPTNSTEASPSPDDPTSGIELSPSVADAAIPRAACSLDHWAKRGAIATKKAVQTQLDEKTRTRAEQTS